MKVERSTDRAAGGPAVPQPARVSVAAAVAQGDVVDAEEPLGPARGQRQGLGVGVDHRLELGGGGAVEDDGVAAEGELATHRRRALLGGAGGARCQPLVGQQGRDVCGVAAAQEPAGLVVHPPPRQQGAAGGLAPQEKVLRHAQLVD